MDVKEKESAPTKEYAPAGLGLSGDQRGGAPDFSAAFAPRSGFYSKLIARGIPLANLLWHGLNQRPKEAARSLAIGCPNKRGRKDEAGR